MSQSTPPSTAIISAINVSRLVADRAQLPESSCLLRHDGYEVWLAEAAAIPAILQEIGRLRELTFRAAGEGTGHAVDLDAFDAWYHHLFVWQVERQAVVGAYRLGFSEDIYSRHGLAGFYTHQLFDYDDDFIQKISPCLELGRSFVRPEDQRSFLPLLLLWRGLATIASRDPRYRRLFGPVSISQDIPALSRWLLAESLLKFHGHPELSARVRPRHPLPHAAKGPDLMAGIAASQELPGLLRRLAPDLKLPVLVRQYLSLNGRLLAFSLDPAFSNTLDGLVLVDLDQVDERTLSRYMGAVAAQLFLKTTGINNERAAAGNPRAA